MFKSNPHHISHPVVSVIGAGNVGSTLAQRIVEKNLADVILLDVVASRSQGVALDLMQARALENHDRQIIGTDDYTHTKDSDVIVITAGVPRKDGMSRDDLLKINAKIVSEVTLRAISHSPNAVIIVVTNPLDVMTYLTWEISGFATNKVMGMAGVLDASRFQAFIAMELGTSTADINAMVMGGHGDLMVPLPRYSTVSGVPITELMSADAIARLVDRTRNGGAEIVKLLQTGSAYFAPASAAYLMVESILRNRRRIIPAAAYLQGEYGLEGLFMGVPVQLGQEGVDMVVELGLSPEELEALHTSATSVRANIQRLKAIHER
ncbi:malate dehydrogenase (NAD) [Synechococcus sp. PCC 7502]|uniref:malate dehydrogenase n=1 Tax=Synechococcus sp. PCC 7502 TaxID=1173263 RepID=UPI00029F8B76|nr:malate dehydrogenase [Synechococcus sp. PCC 7502]AFY72424.1 malate dehydrogenase (NAD) [Synechococcus sp. PCC 7502]